jgi:hypothetical protein
MAEAALPEAERRVVAAQGPVAVLAQEARAAAPRGPQARAEVQAVVVERLTKSKKTVTTSLGFAKLTDSRLLV